MKRIERIEYDSGLVMFENVISPSLIKRFNDEIDRLRAGSDAYPGKLLNEKAEAIVAELREHGEFHRIEKFCRRVSRLRFSAAFLRTAPGDGKCYVRCANTLSDAASHLRHFDSYLMTILVPIKIVEAPGDNGDLIVYKKKNYSTSVAGNIFRKSLTKLDNFLPLTYRKKKTLWQLEKKRCDRILCKTGNIYFFNGYNTKHCNFSVGTSERRTLLVHDYDPDNSLGLSNFARLFRT
jgi:hypothetical protein